ncbi:hypothetical protein [Falsiroseomonas sp.]|uniref:hypothetical protein n=1 Tax=Falsiroseomonas sp. TaxID=2870721 RepID=UPI003F717AF3
MAVDPSLTKGGPGYPRRPADLDALYGVPLDPTRVDDHERTRKPRSLVRLDAASAVRLRLLVVAAQQGLGVARYVYSELPILWVIDQGGTLWFALEEVIDAATHAFVSPRLRGTPTTPSQQRLGHPALLGGEKGRIGGEIIFDLGERPYRWFITNASGRYGLRAGREHIHLENAAKLFSGHDIDVVASFIQPRRGSS